MTTTPGLDISVWQDENSTPQMFDPIKAYAAGARFVFIKASEGVLLDPDMLMNWQNCKGKLYRGAYHYFRWQYSPLDQARFFAGVLKADPGELPPVIDFESRNGVPGRVAAVAGLTMFVTEFERITGKQQQLMIYTGPSFWREYGSTAAAWAERPLWIANYGTTTPAIPPPWQKWDFWQYSAHGPGLVYGAESLNIDMNYYNGDLDQMKQRFGLDGVKPVETQLDRIERGMDELLRRG